MTRMRKTALNLTAVLLAGLVLLPQNSLAQEEVTSAIRRYKQYEVSSGFYEEYEVLPRRQRALVEIPGVSQGIFPYSPAAAPVRVRTRLADSHQGIKFYNVLRCQYCHTTETDDIHTTRANLTCRQCHGIGFMLPWMTDGFDGNGFYPRIFLPAKMKL